MSPRPAYSESSSLNQRSDEELFSRKATIELHQRILHSSSKVCHHLDLHATWNCQLHVMLFIHCQICLAIFTKRYSCICTGSFPLLATLVEQEKKHSDHLLPVDLIRQHPDILAKECCPTDWKDRRPFETNTLQILGAKPTITSELRDT